MLAVVTGTLYPKASVFRVNLSDAEERLKQYAECLRFLSESREVTKIVFCDNSGCFDLMEKLKVMNGDIQNAEYLCFKGSDDVVKYGKGYGEGEILKYVWNNSELLRTETEFIKITGRIIIRNLDMVIQKMKPEINYFNTVRPFTRDGQIDTKFYKISKESFEKYFLDVYKQVRDQENVYLEHVYYNVIKNEKIKHRNFSVYPVYEGVSGSIGTSYGSAKWKYFIKNLLSKINLYKNF